MNFLAHQYLSFANPDLRIGNFLADFVRGDKLKSFSESITKGIELHRAIDHFTDTHPKVKESIILLKTRQGKYASVILDIYYDYFLAKNWSKFASQPLEEFSQSVYKDFEKKREVFPLKMEEALNSLIEHDWLTNYQNYYGISMALKNIERRASFDNSISHALQDLKELETELEVNFMLFFPEIVKMAHEFIEQIKKD